MDPRGKFGRINQNIKRTTIHGYTTNMKALGLEVSEKKIFLCYTYDPPGRGPYGPQGHGWQDL